MLAKYNFFYDSFLWLFEIRSDDEYPVCRYKYANKITDDARMFVIPEDSTFNRDLVRGSLIIM